MWWSTKQHVSRVWGTSKTTLNCRPVDLTQTETRPSSAKGLWCAMLNCAVWDDWSVQLPRSYHVYFPRDFDSAEPPGPENLCSFHIFCLFFSWRKYPKIAIIKLDLLSLCTQKICIWIYYCNFVKILFFTKFYKRWNFKSSYISYYYS